MKVTKEKSAANRAAILKAAAELFRARGLDGVGVAEIMQAAGLTHGGFYGHFASKDALAAEACGSAFAEGVAKVSRDTDASSYVARYLNERHRDQPDGGCPMSALGSEISHQETAVQKGFSEGVAVYLDAVTEMLARSGEGDAPETRARAIALVSGLVGGMMLARATAGTKPDLSQEILAALPQGLTGSVLPKN